MNKILLPAFAIALGLSSCNGGKTDGKKAQSSAVADDPLNTSFKQYSNYFAETLWANNPEWATEKGYHKYDTLLTIPGADSRAKNLSFVEAQLDSLKAYDPAGLTPSNFTDLQMIKNYLESQKWSLTKLKRYEWSPSDYNVTGLIAFMLSENYAPLSKRLQDCYKRMEQIPAYYKAAAEQLKNPVDELKLCYFPQKHERLYTT
jgi:hypothetical protein